MVKIKVPRGNFLLQWNPTLYVCENENLIFRIQIGEMVKIFLIDIFCTYQGTGISRDGPGQRIPGTSRDKGPREIRETGH